MQTIKDVLEKSNETEKAIIALLTDLEDRTGVVFSVLFSNTGKSRILKLAPIGIQMGGIEDNAGHDPEQAEEPEDQNQELVIEQEEG